MEFFEEIGNFLGNGTIPITKYKSKTSDMTIYFATIDSQVINGYFCYGVDQPESTGIETMLWHLDSSGGLLPRQMRGDIIRPTWQHHGAENPLADRDQSTYVCCALGETAFLGTFSCSIYLLQNIETVFDINGYPPEYKRVRKTMTNEENSEQQGNKSAREGGEPGLEDGEIVQVQQQNEINDIDFDTDYEPNLSSRQFYFLSEAGEGAMGWEATLQVMFPGVRAFWNRLLSDPKTKVSRKMRNCYDNFYRPQNLTVIITGTVQERTQIFETLHDYEDEYKFTRIGCDPFVPPWKDPLPLRTEGINLEIPFIPRNPNRDPMATICFGWRGCLSIDFDTALALKVFTAYTAVGPLWNEFVSNSLAHRISWCQLEYIENCALITVHGISCNEHVKEITTRTKTILTRLGDPDDDLLNLNELQAMANRVGWHYVRELEADPFLILAASISKGERYGNGDPTHIEKRIHPRLVFDKLLEKPIEYWKSLAQNYYSNEYTFMTSVIPKNYTKDNLPKPDVCCGGLTPPNHEEEESCAEQTFVDSSRRASSRPRRKTNSVIQDLSQSVAGLTEDFINDNPTTTTTSEEHVESTENEVQQQDVLEGHIEELLRTNPFPFGDNEDEACHFEGRLKMTQDFLEQVNESNLRYYPFTTYRSDGEEQHPNFSITELPFFTFLEDTESSFLYVTFVLDTSHLDETERKLVGPITAALGAVLCPRPPGLDTDTEIQDPCEFNPPQCISDSQVSLGLNGEMMQNIFATMIILPEYYEWMIGMFHFLLYQIKFTDNFLTFIAGEAAKGLACSYKTQTAEIPNYECFDATEINLHSLVKLIYKQESNARLFVGRRRLDLMNEYIIGLMNDSEQFTTLTNTTWDKIVNQGKIIVQIAGNIEKLTKIYPDPVTPWKNIFANDVIAQNPLKFSTSQPTIEKEMIIHPYGSEGIVVSVNHARPSCLSLAIPINPSSEDFPKLCLVAQLFSMAQKWVWNCLDEEDVVQPVLRMPCSYSNILTLNLESSDVIGSLEAMKLIINTEWPWLNTLLIATKLMVVNDPASLDIGPQGVIASALLSHLNDQPLNYRRDLVKESLRLTVDDIKKVITDHLIHLFDPKKSWYSLMSYGDEEKKLMTRLKTLGYNFKKTNLTELCMNL